MSDLSPESATEFGPASVDPEAHGAEAPDAPDAPVGAPSARSRRSPLSGVSRLRQRASAGLVARAAHPLVVGAEHVPDGAVVVACNHPGRTDRQLLEAALTDGGARPRRVHVTSLDDAADVDRARAALARDEQVVVFFEGDRSPDGSVHRARPEFGVLVTGVQTPVVPAAIHPPVDRRGWLAVSGAAGPSVEFAAPLDLERHREMPDDSLAQQAAADAVVHAVTVLAGQPYVDAAPGEHRAQLRQQAAAERIARGQEARARRLAAEQARAEAERAAREDAERLARELAEAERAAREHAARAAEQDAARRAALQATRLPAHGSEVHGSGAPRDPRQPPPIGVPKPPTSPA